MKKLFSNPALQIGAVLVVLSLMTLVLPVSLGRVTQIAIMTLYVAGTAVLISYVGLIPFGGSLFFGLAGYVAAIGLLRWFGDVNELVGLLAALAFSVALAVPVGFLILRRSGLYFSLLTIACTQISYEIVYKWTSVTGGENGLQNVPRPMMVSNVSLHAFVLILVVAVIAAVWRIVHSPMGRLFQAVRDNEQRTISLGYAVFPIKLAGFVLYAAVTGLGGRLDDALLAGRLSEPAFLGACARAGADAGAGRRPPLPRLGLGRDEFIVLQDQLSALIAKWWLIFAPILMVVALTSPEGLQGLLRQLRGRQGLDAGPPCPIPPRPASIDASSRSTGTGADSGEPLLQVRGLTKSFGKLVVASGLRLRRPCRDAAQLHRSQRRGQDHLLQHADRPHPVRTPAR